MRVTHRLPLSLLGIALVVSACAGAPPAGVARRVVAVTGADGVQRATIVGSSYRFEPDTLVVKVNVPVELTLRKEADVVPHNFVLREPEAGLDIVRALSMEPVVVRFTPRKTGSYPYYCSKKLLFFASHREKGMAGVLEVVE